MKNKTTNTNKATDTNTNNAPVQKFSAKSRGGVIIASIWENQHDERSFFSVSLERRYKTDDGWQSTGSFGVDDLSRVQLVTSQVFDYLAAMPES